MELDRGTIQRDNGILELDKWIKQLDKKMMELEYTDNIQIMIIMEET